MMSVSLVRVHIVPICEREEVLMFLQILTLKYFEEQLHTYVIEKKDEYEIINLKDAKDIV